MCYPSKTSIFSLKTIFQRLWENFLCVVYLRSSYLKHCLKIVLYDSKKIRNVRHVEQILWQETQKVTFLLWKWGWGTIGLSLKNSIFDSKLFFHELLKNFLFIVWSCLIYLKDALNIVLYSNKKIGTVRHTNKKIFTKPRKKTHFYRLPFVPL